MTGDPAQTSHDTVFGPRDEGGGANSPSRKLGSAITFELPTIHPERRVSRPTTPLLGPDVDETRARVSLACAARGRGCYAACTSQFVAITAPSHAGGNDFMLTLPAASAPSWRIAEARAPTE